MKIGFYNPYYDGLGGGERYTLTLASHWSKTHDTVIFWDDPNILGRAERRFGLDLSRVGVTPNIFRNGNIFSKLLISRTYDLIFFLSDGSIPASLARHNILHFQVPFPSVLTDPLKLKRYDAVVCNSEFTKRHLDQVLGERASVIYPPVQQVPQGTVKKKKRILSVGRFTGCHQAKKQDILIAAFAGLQAQKKYRDWELVLAGGLIPSDEAFYQSLREKSNGLPVRLLPNISNDELLELYRTSTLYWHAAGYGVSDPQQMEHFGITTAESMSAGTVPLVYAAGGQLEIVEDMQCGVVWKTIDELVKKTGMLIDDGGLRTSMSREAVRRAAEYDESRFTRGFDAIMAGWK